MPSWKRGTPPDPPHLGWTSYLATIKGDGNRWVQELIWIERHWVRTNAMPLPRTWQVVAWMPMPEPDKYRGVEK